ncbi:hypothetical protein CRG98_015325 [Punica granatum]|uniref:Uncharacterized protein n=1 Tax=Punica granatum TaxID=22663 RepID=A0A2I0K6V6_PUNGR|nr:hypothetical protein CRG98_015325 [Punica granatum]
MPECTSLGNTHRGWMMSEVVSARALNTNAPVFIVDVTRGGTSMPSPFPVKVYGKRLERSSRKGVAIMLTIGPELEPWSWRRFVRTRMWTLVGARIAHFWIARLGSVHLPVGTHDGHA